MKEQRIKKIELATNGILLFSEDVLTLLEGNTKTKLNIEICISDYGKNSSKKDMLIEQLPRPVLHIQSDQINGGKQVIYHEEIVMQIH